MFAVEFGADKNRENIKNHEISLDWFFNMVPASWLIVEDTRKDYGERRFAFLGIIPNAPIAAELFQATVTFRGAHYRVISLRPASRRERRLYDEA